MAKEFNARIQQKRDTAANWESANPILLNGEIVLVNMPDGSIRTKTGDGTTNYISLSFDDSWHTGDTTNPHSVTAAQVGLGNVDNTADVDKPISTAVQETLDTKQDTLTFDTEPTYRSTNPVTSNGIYQYVNAEISYYVKAEAFGVQTSGDGNAITSLEYGPDADGSFYATKDETFATQAALDAKIVLSESEPTTQNTGDLWLKLTS